MTEVVLVVVFQSTRPQVSCVTEASQVEALPGWHLSGVPSLGRCRTKPHSQPGIKGTGASLGRQRMLKICPVGYYIQLLELQ